MESRHQRLFTHEEELNYLNSLNELTMFLLSDNEDQSERNLKIQEAGNLSNALADFNNFCDKKSSQ
jgi:hypothetical protein